MADNFPQTPGTGRNVATDQVTYSGDTADVQLVRVVNTTGVEGSRVVTDKPVFQTEDLAHTDGDLGVLMLGVRNHFTGSTADGDYSALSVSSYGDLHTVSRRDLIRISTAVPGVTTATTTYASGDQLGTIMTLSNASRANASTYPGGTITGLQLIDPSAVIGPCDVLFFDSTVTLAADNAAFNLATRTDYLKLIAMVPLAGGYVLGTNGRIAQAMNLAIPFIPSGSTSLFATIITRSANAVFAQNATAAVTLNVFIERN